MKKFALVALLLSLGVFATACNKPADKKPADTAPPADKMEPAAPDTTPPAEPAK